MGIVLYLIVFIITLMIINKLTCFWSRSKVCLIGKTAIVTGSASGLGYQVALALAAKGCRVILADVADTTDCVAKIKEETHNPQVIGKHLDLQSFRSVRNFADDIVKTENRLDILMNNAGTNLQKIEYTEDGLHKIMQINYYSHFLLTHLLLDLLKTSAPSRIVFTSSIAAYVSNVSVESLKADKPNDNWLYISLYGHYNASRLMTTAASKTFSDKLKGSGITVNAVHPSGVKTNLYMTAAKNEEAPFRLLYGSVFVLLVWILGKNSEEGAQTLIHLAQSDEVKNITGRSFIEGIRVPHPLGMNEEFCRKLWDYSIECCKLDSKEIKC